MVRTFSFLAGAICGALVGGVAALLLAPSSGEQMIAGAEARWQDALAEARQAMNNKRQEMEDEFQRASTT